MAECKRFDVPIETLLRRDVASGLIVALLFNRLLKFCVMEQFPAC
jgi:hypothetical protein